MESSQNRNEKEQETDKPADSDSEESGRSGEGEDDRMIKKSMVNELSSSAGNSLSEHRTTSETMIKKTPYVKYCHLCDFKTIDTTDPAAYLGAVADLDSHMARMHPEAKDDEQDGAGTEEFDRATQLRKVPSGQDDHLSNLLSVRFYREPLSWKHSQLGLRKVQTPFCTVVDQSPIGLQVTNRKVLAALHNRADRSLQLIQLSDKNLRMSVSEQKNSLGFDKETGGKLVSSKGFVRFKDVGDAVKAVLNYSDLMRHFHPLDTGPRALFRVFFERFLRGEIPSVEWVKDFFKKIYWDLAGRASRNEVPLKNEEIVVHLFPIGNSLLTYILRSNGKPRLSCPKDRVVVTPAVFERSRT